MSASERASKTARFAPSYRFGPTDYTHQHVPFMPLLNSAIARTIIHSDDYLNRHGKRTSGVRKLTGVEVFSAVFSVLVIDVSGAFSSSVVVVQPDAIRNMEQTIRIETRTTNPPAIDVWNNTCYILVKTEFIVKRV